MKVVHDGRRREKMKGGRGAPTNYFSVQSGGWGVWWHDARAMHYREKDNGKNAHVLL
jgi:hypothetical protein